MGNKLDQQNDLENVEICPKNLSNNILINNFSSNLERPSKENLELDLRDSFSNTFGDSFKDKFRDTYSDNFRGHFEDNLRDNLEYNLKDNFKDNPECNLISTELNECATKSKSIFKFKKKKRKNKSNKKNFELLTKSSQLESDLIEQNLNKHTQTGNGLVSLKNLNFYLQSDTQFHLVNRILKRLGVYNQQTQTDFEPFDDECFKIIEVTQNLAGQLDHLNSGHRFAIEEQQEDDPNNEAFNMIYCGRNNHKKNKRNVCIQRCIGRATVGTNTVLSIVHLTIIKILKRLSELDERVKLIGELNKEVNEKVINSIKSNDLIENFDTFQDRENDKQLNNFEDNFQKVFGTTLNDCFGDDFLEEEDKFENKFDDNFNDLMLINFRDNRFKNSNQFKRKSDTFILNNSGNFKTIYKGKFNSQPELKIKSSKSLRMGSITMNNQTNDEDGLKSMNKQKLEEYLKNLLLQVQRSQEHQKKVKSRNACVQTMNDLITDELPEYAARCPSLRKKELIYSSTLFNEIDKRALEAPKFNKLNDLVEFLTKNCENDIFKVRSMFRWITNNMCFDWKYIEEQHKKMLKNQLKEAPSINEQDANEFNNNIIKEEDEEAYLKDEHLQSECLRNEYNQLQTRIDTIYQTKLGGSKEFVELFLEMCKNCDIRCKLIQGFAKNYDYRPGHLFFEEDVNNLTNLHHWVAVFVLGNWHLIDLTWATGYTDPIGKFQRKLNEFYFFTDPENLIWSHFPFNKLEREYERWQLLDKPITLDNFNNLPKITANFLEFNLKLRSKIANPINFKVQTEIRISSHEPLRYKYKLFHVDELENCSLNNFVFCQLKEDRLIASFVVCPPIEGRYYLKVYAKSEKEMQDQSQANASLNYILTMLLDCAKARKYQNPYPLNELPYGPVQAFYTYQMQLVNQSSAIISTFGGKRKLVMQCNEPMLLTYQIMDADNQEQDTRTMIQRDDENSNNLIILQILPPRVGMFKLSIFGAPRQKPNQRGKMRLPLLATFLIDCRLAKIVSKQDVDPAPMSAELIDNLGKKLGSKDNY